MKPGFILNCHDRNQNPLFEAHDPSMMWDPVSHTYYSYCTDSAITSEFRQGIPVRKSKNLVDFTFAGYALSDRAVREGRDNGAWPPTRGFWAPYTEYIPPRGWERTGEYRMYYSATKAFGSSESRIWLAVAKNPEGPFENRGVVMDTWGTDNSYPNAIDPHVIDTPEGRKYLVYGSFFGGIFLKELNPDTGLSLDGDAFSLGTRLAVRPRRAHVDGPEGASIIYHEESGYYYLFLSYGWLGDDYDVRVGRSRQVEGPYLDETGRSLNGESLGLKMLGSYCFTGNNPYAAHGLSGTVGPEKQPVSSKKWTFGGFRAPGHGVPFFDPKTGCYFFVHHVRDGAKELCFYPKKAWERLSYRMHYLVVRQMFWLNGWPVMAPEPYAGEPVISPVRMKISIRKGWITVREISGAEPAEEFLKKTLANRWELIILWGKTNSMQYAAPIDVEEADVLAGSFYDYENSSSCIALTGLCSDGQVLWGKLRKETSHEEAESTCKRQKNQRKA